MRRRRRGCFAQRPAPIRANDRFQAALVDDGLQQTFEPPALRRPLFQLAQIRDRLGALGVLNPRLQIEATRSGWTRTFSGLSSINFTISSAPVRAKVAGIRRTASGRGVGLFRAHPAHDGRHDHERRDCR